MQSEHNGHVKIKWFYGVQYSVLVANCAVHIVRHETDARPKQVGLWLGVYNSLAEALGRAENIALRAGMPMGSLPDENSAANG